MRPEETQALRHAVRPALDSLITLAEQRNLTEVSVRQGALSVHIRRQARPASPSVAVLPPPSPPSGATEALEHQMLPVHSTLVGIFHTPGPGKGPTQGDLVQAGEVLAWVESMHLMNEVRSPQDGRLAAVLVEDGLPVEYGQPLLVLDVTPPEG